MRWREKEREREKVRMRAHVRDDIMNFCYNNRILNPMWVAAQYILRLPKRCKGASGVEKKMKNETDEAF